ncbi:Ribosomal RNA-processing protein 7 [Mortierella claussenii]|nr:Ribosomal RNA-processing protein 7 [Mortierella claussenii]
MVSKKSKKVSSEDSSSSGSSSTLDQIANFYILPVHMPNITCSPSSSSSSYNNVLHYLYFKKHESPKQDTKSPKDRTLFVLNVPVDATESHLRELFKPYGRVASIHFLNRIRDNSHLTKEEREQQEELERLEQEAAVLEEAQSQSSSSNNGKSKGKKGSKNQQQPSSTATTSEQHESRRIVLATGSQAYVVFLEEQELTKALSMKRKRRSWIGDDNSKLTSLGISKWMNDYHRMRPDHTTLQAQVDDYMDKFERSEYEAQQAALARLNVMDDDGFTLVTRAGNKGHNTDGVIKVQAAKVEDVKNLKPKKKELQDFYRFQMREAKRDKLVELRRKFEEDKIRIEALKVNRRFRPY